MSRGRLLAPVTAIALGAVLLAACGGEAATATSRPAPPTQPPATATATSTPATAAPTRPPATPTATSASATPTPRPGAIPTPIIKEGKRGGILQLSVQTSYMVFFDTFSAGGRAAVVPRSALLNNLIWPDPYGNGTTLVGDAAQGWEFSEAGKVITFSLNKNIKFHDGTGLTSKDAAYALDRAWKPRDARMTEFKGKLNALAKIETPDNYTLKVTLQQPSNFFLNVVGTTRFLLYPSSIPFPEKFDEWKKSQIGSGPFKFKNEEANVKHELVRNDSYWKPGLPYVDGIVMNEINDNTAVLSAYRTRKIDAVSLDYTPIQNDTDVLVREQGFQRYKITAGMWGGHLNQREPWTNPKAREAVHLAIDRQAIVDVWLRGKGTPYASPMLPPELGGQFGYPEAEMKNMPGFRQDKTQDVARGKQLLAEAGIDPSKFTVNIVADKASSQEVGEVVESGVRALGFKTKYDPLLTNQLTERSINRDFDMLITVHTVETDDPLDHLSDWVVTGGGPNYPKWSDPVLDNLFIEQDKILDVAKRKPVVRQLQERVLEDRHLLPLVWRQVYSGHMPWIKNYTATMPFGFSPRYRWEQVWIDRK